MARLQMEKTALICEQGHRFEAWCWTHEPPPLCKVCGGVTGLFRGEAAQSTAIARDEIPGGVVLENYGPQPIRFDSHSERRAYMAAHGLQEREKFSPMPGTDKDPAGIPNPAGYVDGKTLENGRILLMRQQNAPKTVAPEDHPDAQIKEGEVISINHSGALPKSEKKRWRKYGI